MASSPQNPPHHLPTPFAATATATATATAAPPPTPSAQPNLPAQPSTSDFISHLLHRLPPSLSLSLSSRRSFPLSAAAAAPAATPPLLSLSSLHSSLLPACTELGFFHLADHPISAAAESAARSLFDLPDDRKQFLFPSNWPYGHDTEDEDSAATESFCLDDSACSVKSTGELDLGPLREFAAEMERLGLAVVEALATAAGFERPEREKLCSLVWISSGSGKPGRVYPYVVGLHYQIQRQNQSLLSDSGWVSVSNRADSPLVTIGDIAQVWSNGKVKKVRGRPIPSLGEEEEEEEEEKEKVNHNSRHLTMSLLITLPLETTVFPLIPGLVENQDDDDDDDSDNKIKSLFSSFSFEDYAWRVYHERVLLKDPLVRYRV